MAKEVEGALAGFLKKGEKVLITYKVRYSLIRYSGGGGGVLLVRLQLFAEQQVTYLCPLIRMSHDLPVCKKSSLIKRLRLKFVVTFFILA
jgi:hypothetical protein